MKRFVVSLLCLCATAMGQQPRVVYLENMASRWGEIIKTCDPPLDNTGYDPRCTIIVTSWQPMVWQAAPGKWQIYFILPKK